MRKTKPPVGWEHVKNCFPVPNILLDMDLPASAVAVYLYLLRSADRKTDQCHPSEATIAKRLHLSRNTVAKYVRLLEERGLIITEHTKIITKNGIKKNGNLLYTLVSMHEITQAYYDRQFEKAELATMQQKAKAKAEKLGISMQEVIEMWEQKGKESRDLGTIMHQKIENYFKGIDSPNDEAFMLFKTFANNFKLSPYRTEWSVYDWDYKIAGTIDFVDYQNGEFSIYDWKRSDKVIVNGLPIKNNKYGEKGIYPLENLDNSPYYHYALQLSLYKFILERNYNIKVSKLRLGIFHPSYNKPYILEMPYFEKELNSIFNLRSEIIF